MLWNLVTHKELYVSVVHLYVSEKSSEGASQQMRPHRIVPFIITQFFSCQVFKRLLNSSLAYGIDQVLLFQGSQVFV